MVKTTFDQNPDDEGQGEESGMQGMRFPRRRCWDTYFDPGDKKFTMPPRFVYTGFNQRRKEKAEKTLTFSDLDATQKQRFINEGAQTASTLMSQISSESNPQLRYNLLCSLTILQQIVERASTFWPQVKQ